MGVYSVQITKQATEQMNEIALYIAKELLNQDAALRILDAFEDAVFSLEENPQRIMLMSEEPWRSQGVHQMIVENFYLYFWIDEETKVVHITATIYQKREQRKALGKMSMR